jgi:hypothetical protein
MREPKLIVTRAEYISTQPHMYLGKEDNSDAKHSA